MGLNDDEPYPTQMEILPHKEMTPLHIQTLPEEVQPEVKQLNEQATQKAGALSQQNEEPPADVESAFKDVIKSPNNAEEPLAHRTESSNPPSRHQPTPKEGSSKMDDSPNPTVPSRRDSDEKLSLLNNEPEREIDEE